MYLYLGEQGSRRVNWRRKHEDIRDAMKKITKA